jgi:DnaJ family protein B protein 4
VASSSSQKEPSTSTRQLEKPPPVEKTLMCSLEELFNGTKKKMKITRNVAKPDGYVSTFTIYTHVLKVLFNPGKTSMKLEM